MEKEELMQLQKEELVEKFLELTKNSELWWKAYNETKEKFKLYKDAVKSVVLYID